MLKFNDPIKTDILVVGGGIGGLCAAIAAASGGADTIVVEKADSRRSGSGATGNDHFLTYYPKFHGNDIMPILKETRQSLVGAYHDNKLTLKFLQNTLPVVEKWQDWGINMKPFGDDFEFMGHAYPGRPRIWLKYDGHNQKQVLTRQAKRAGAKILNHHPVVELLVHDGRAVGALALNIENETPTFTVIHANKVILATGTANRLYPSAASPGWPFNTAFCPSCTGAAQAQGWRAGAKMVNMEMPNRHAGPKFFSRAGKSTWIGVYRYPDGKLLGPFVKEATRYVGDITCDVWNSSYTDVLLNGTGPAYIDCSATSKEDLEFMRAGMLSEGLSSLLDYMDRTNLDVSREAVEFMQYEPHIIGRGLQIDENGETSISGLYAAGDMVGNFRADIAGAAVYGWIAGGHAASSNEKTDAATDSGWIEERADYYSRFYERPHGAAWKEANLALQQIMDSYAAAGPHRLRSATLLNAGLKYLADLRKNSEEQIKVGNAHELMRAIEVMDLMDNGEIVMEAALERKESRDMHRRSDYTFTNPLLSDKFLMINKNENGEIIKEWRQCWDIQV